MFIGVPNHVDVGGPGMDHALSNASLESDNRLTPCLHTGPPCTPHRVCTQVPPRCLRTLTSPRLTPDSCHLFHLQDRHTVHPI